MGWVDSISRVVMPGGVMYYEKEKVVIFTIQHRLLKLVSELSKIFLKNTIL